MSAELNTAAGVPVDTELLINYLKSLVNRFFKILPIRENDDASLAVYMRSLQLEMTGCGDFISALKSDASYLSLLSILQYLIDHPDCSVAEVRREVFGAISICNKLKATYADGGAER